MVLTPAQSNKLQLEQQLIKISLIENALMYTFNGESRLHGLVVDSSTLKRAKNDLNELIRVQDIHNGGGYKKLEYFNSPGSRVDKVKDHFDKDDGTLSFIEVKQSSSGKFVVNHKQSKSSILKQIKQKQMATKKKVAPKKAAKKAAPKKKGAAKKSVKTEGDSIRSRVDKLVGKGLDNAAIMEQLDKDGIVYSIKSVRWYASKARAL